MFSQARRWILGEPPDHRFEFLEPYGSCRVGMVSKVPGSTEGARGVPKLRGTVSGCLSHTKVFHTVVRSRGRENCGPIPWAGVASTAHPGRPLSPLLSFVPTSPCFPSCRSKQMRAGYSSGTRTALSTHGHVDEPLKKRPNYKREHSVV